jgi:cold shock CspA family protein
MDQERCTGIVDAVKGGGSYGFIRPADGMGKTLFFHWRALSDEFRNDRGRREAQPGQQVTYRIGWTERGSCAEDIKLEKD